MSKDDTNSNQEHAEGEQNEVENSGTSNSKMEDDVDDGYRTPTTEKHKIPAVVLSCPPPAPRKRKRLVLIRPVDLQRQLDRVIDEKTIVIRESDLDLFLTSLAGESRVSPASRPTTGAKRECVRD